MKLKDLLEKTEVTSIAADLGMQVHGLCYDTRRIKAGELFVAIKGYESDGHSFIGKAVTEGAVCVICEEPPDVAVPYVIVNDSRKTLAAVSAAWFGYPAAGLKLVGVTGTNGKTTVTTLIKQILEKCTGAKVGLIGTNVNMIGGTELQTERTTPESYDLHALLAMMVREGCKYAVIEVSSHALLMSRVHGIQFDVGVYTNLTPEHLDIHLTMDEYARIKSRLFASCRMAAVNIDDEYAPVMINAAQCPVMTYSLKTDAADLVGKNIKLHPEKVEFCALTIGILTRAALKIPGMFSVYNALAAIAAVKLTGIDIECATVALETCKGAKGRTEVVPTPLSDCTVLIDYAHTPDALENIISAARTFTKSRVITLFGCGGDRYKEKRPQMGAIAAKLSDYVIVTSDNPRTEAPCDIINDILEGMKDTRTPYSVIENRGQAIYWALENTREGDVLLLAGKGHETYQIVGKDKTKFDEREVVAGFFARNRP